jgi:hypothetical protein
MIMCEKKTIFEVGKTYKTREGRDARVICVDMAGGPPIVALVVVDRGPDCEGIFRYYVDGSHSKSGESSNDLMPPTRTVWVNFYATRCACSAQWHDTKEDALEYVSKNKVIATAIPVEIPMEVE